MNNLFKHLKTVNTHRKYVRKMCFKMGIPWQGLIHDLSKYSPKELSIYRYYIGTRSPHEICREKEGASIRWAYHYHKNKHHWEYYLDIVDFPDKIFAAKMPYKYVIEMFCDRVGASKAYLKDRYSDSEPLKYWENCSEGKVVMHKDSEKLIKYLLYYFNKLGERSFLDWYNNFKKYLKYSYEKGIINNVN